MRSALLEAREVSVQEFPGTEPIESQLRFLIRWAVLAPSSRNIQPWRFAVEGATVRLFADPTNWQRVADRDAREIYLSLGCALENLLVAAEQLGFRHQVALLPLGPQDALVASVEFAPGGGAAPERAATTLDSLLRRRTARGPYAMEPLPVADREALAACAVESGVDVIWSEDEERRAAAEFLNRMALSISCADPAYRHEMAHWVGQGNLGTPRPAALLGRLTMGSRGVARWLARLEGASVRYSPLLALIGSWEDDRPAQVRSGQVLERIWLTATSRGLGLQPLSAALEVPELRASLSHRFGAPWPWAQQLVRIGRPRAGVGWITPRRPAEEVTMRVGGAASGEFGDGRVRG